jgi:hypothetical protein
MKYDNQSLFIVRSTYAFDPEIAQLMELESKAAA